MNSRQSFRNSHTVSLSPKGGIMDIDPGIMQSKTVNTIVTVLKKARTITKNNTNAAKNINSTIDFIIKEHQRAKDVKTGVKPRAKIGTSSFLGNYKVNL